jgi:hypothetical protein
MPETRKVIVLFTMITAIILLIAVGCKKDDSPAPKTTYSLKVTDKLGVTGTVTFTQTTSSTTTIEIAVNNAPSGTHPASLCINSAIENGPAVISLNPVDATGKSSTIVTEMNYSQLIAYDGYIKVTKSSSEPEVILANGDIGGNVITTTNKSYILTTVGAFNVTGTALFEKRTNGNTLVTISLSGTISGQEYPATIHLGSIASVGGGPVVILLNNVNGTTGKSYTNIQKLDSGIDITYENWLVYDGFINVYKTPGNLGNIICQVNIGSN